MDRQLNFQDSDKFQRKHFADRLTTVISNFYHFYNEAFVLSLNAKFGAGKTTFLRMWQNQLQQEDFTVLYINAWETDFDDEPLIPIISAFLDGINTGQGIKKLKTVLRGTLGTVVLAGNDLLGNISGINIKEILKEVEADLNGTDIQALGAELYKEHSFKKKAYKTLRSELSTYIEKLHNKPLMVFVDELDRARPNYSVKFLEAIKHIFSIRGVCFVLAVDRDQLKASVEQLYGEIDFENYYKRFVTREAQLPEVTKVDLMPFIQMQAHDFFDEKREAGIKFPFKKKDQRDILEFISLVCKVFRFVPRQIEALFRIFSQLMAVAETEKTAKLIWIKASVILIAIFIDNRSLYNKIGKSSVSPDELFQYINGLDFSNLRSDSYESYFMFITMGFYIKAGPKEDLNRIADLCLEHYEDTPSNDNLDEKRRGMLDRLARGPDEFGSLGQLSGFQSIYNMMEEWKAFIE